MAQSNSGDGKRLNWLLTLRWLAIVGQLATILWVHYGFKVVLPLPWLLGIVVLEALSNLLAQRRSWDEPQDLVVMLMLIDVVALTGLLYFSGGPHNPFNFIYLVNVALASVVLDSRAAWGVLGLSLGLYALLFLDHMPLPDPSSIDPHGAHEAALGRAGHSQAHGQAHGGNGLNAMTLHIRGMWVGFTVAALFTTYFVTRVRRELAEARQRIQDSERLAGLATLAAGAAHELGSPLAAIAVTAKELEYQLAQESNGLTGSSDLSEAVEDARLIRREVDRCRDVLQQMSTQAGESTGEALQSLPLKEIVDLAGEGKSWNGSVTVPPDSQTVAIYGPPRALAQSIGNMCVNAFTAGAAKVTVEAAEVTRDGFPWIAVTIADDGPGMTAATLARCTDPFYTTGGGMGLGLFLARTVVERLGGEFEVTSNSGSGTTVRLWLRQGTV